MNFITVITMANYCILCRESIDDDIESHIAQQHSDPAPKRRDVDGVSMDMSDAEWIRMNRNMTRSGGKEVADSTPAPSQTILESIGIRVEDVDSVETEVDAGASCSESEVKKVFEAVDNWAGFKVDRAHFLVSFLDWGFRTGFSEELTEAGGWIVRSAVTAGDTRKFAKASELHASIRDHLGNTGTGRDFTFRRLGRYFGPTIPNVVARSKALQRFSKHGSDISNRLGVAPILFLACTSIFEYIKPYGKWSDEELAAWTAHNASVRKLPRDARRLPQDLRIDPESASSNRDSGISDFSRRLSDRYGAGQRMYEDMWSGKGTRSGGDKGGLGYE